MRGVPWALLRHSPGTWGAIAAALSAIVVVGTETATGLIVSWNDYNLAVPYALVLAAPTVAAAGAWAGVVQGEHRLVELAASAPRGKAGHHAGQMLGVVVWPLTLFTLVVAGSAATTGAVGAWGRFEPAFLASGIAGIAAAAALGYLAGLLLPRWWLVPLVPVAVYVAMWQADDAASWVGLLGPTTQDRPSVFIALASHVGWLQAAWYAGLAVAAAAFVYAATSRQRRKRLAAGLGGVCLGIVPVLLASTLEPTYRSDERLAVTLECENASDVEVCLHPAYVPHRDEVVGPLREPLRLAARAGLVRRAVQGPQTDSGIEDGELSFMVPTIDGEVYDSALAYVAAYELGQDAEACAAEREAAEDGDDSPALALSEAVVQELIARAGYDPGQWSPEVERRRAALTALEDAEFEAWLVEHLGDVRNCRHVETP